MYLNWKGAKSIDFTVTAALFGNEWIVIERAVRVSGDEAAQRIVDVLVKGRVDASGLARHALDCLAWMIAIDRFVLRIAVPTPESNYHPKIWLSDDGENQVVVRGSGNATDRGVAAGVEHVDVDVSWTPRSRHRVGNGVAMLDAWAQGQSGGIETVVPLPAVLARDIIQTAPDNSRQPRNCQASAGYKAVFRVPF